MIERPLYVEKIMAYTDAPFVKILTGVRRCGKSTILKMIMEKLQAERDVPADRIVSYRFDSMEYEDFTARQMFAELRSKLSPNGKTYLFLDEVQEITGWEKVINSLAADYDVDLCYRFQLPHDVIRDFDIPDRQICCLQNLYAFFF